MTPPLKVKIILVFILILVIALAVEESLDVTKPSTFPTNFWDVRSIDTAKFSRDLAREKISDPSFDQVIDQQVSDIASTGANYVAIDTPYDEEFVPFLQRWVLSARKHNLNVWFRGNFSGWEQWFSYAKISPQEHTADLQSFIIQHPQLFADGDIFSTCPECENGSIGDPRATGDVTGFRNFLINENSIASQAFKQIGKDVSTNYFSMNLDVANLVMDPQTTQALGGVITVDHYADSSEKFGQDLQMLEKNTNAKIVLGEFGAPIPDLNGVFTDQQQADYINQMMNSMVQIPNIIGVNYWSSYGGSTEIWKSDGTATPSVAVISQYYRPEVISGFVVDELSKPIANAEVQASDRTVFTDGYGKYVIPVIQNQDLQLTVSAKGFVTKQIDAKPDNSEIMLTKINEGIWFRLLKKFRPRKGLGGN
jgi:hypothetical protein